MYYDRLTDDNDRNWLYNYTREVTQKSLKEDFDQMLIHLDSDGDGKVRHVCLPGLRGSYGDRSSEFVVW